MPIQKVEITTILLIEADTPQEAGALLSAAALGTIGDLLDQGEAVGNTEVKTVSTVAPDRLEDELQALGSDMSFFAGENEEDHQRVAA